jgi:hypothetical protein
VFFQSLRGKFIMPFTRLPQALSAVLLVVLGSFRVVAQTPEPPAVLKYIPPDAVAVWSLDARAVAAEESLRMLPWEVYQAAGLEHVGYDPLNLSQIDVIVGVPLPTGPQVAILLTLKEPLDPEKLNAELFVPDAPRVAAGLTFYELADAPFPAVATWIDPQHVLVGPQGYLTRLLKSRLGEGEARAAVARLHTNRGHALLVVALEPLRDMLRGLAESPAVPEPVVEPLLALVEKTRLVYMRAELGSKGSFAVALEGADEAGAVEMEDSWNEILAFATQVFLAQMLQEMEGREGAVDRAMTAYMERLVREISGQMTPTRRGNRLAIRVDTNPMLVPQVGVLVGLLLPAVQAAREAARRVQAANNLKQIGLAMHNYESVFKEFPSVAEGEKRNRSPLSWRVQILPFIEQAALYEKFRHDEPWDSPHNIQLLEEMPDIFRHPQSLAEPGYTVFQASVGAGALFEAGKPTRFRDITDGTSNTIMVVETADEYAVPWTKPEDVNLLESPEQLRELRGMITVLFTDGAVLQLPADLDAETLRGLVTRAGGEVVRFPLGR